VVAETLAQIGAGTIPVITALNKIDLLPQPAEASEILSQYRNGTPISAHTGAGIPDLLRSVRSELFESYRQITVRLPYTEGNLIALFHDLGQVERIEHSRGGVTLHGRLPGRILAQFTPWLSKRSVDAAGEDPAKTADRQPPSQPSAVK
jgi:GTP-binding protein HflX